MRALTTGIRVFARRQGDLAHRFKQCRSSLELSHDVRLVLSLCCLKGRRMARDSEAEELEKGARGNPRFISPTLTLTEVQRGAYDTQPIPNFHGIGSSFRCERNKNERFIDLLHSDCN